MIIVSTLSIGSELLMGQITDRNASFISKKLHDLSYRVRCHSIVDDDLDQISEELNRLFSYSDVVIVTGGLGPTSDDVTRFAVAKWAAVNLEFDENSWQRVEQYFLSRKRHVPEINKVQCKFPVGSKIIENLNGTADAFVLEKDGKTVVCLPGPPREMNPIFENQIVPDLQIKFPVKHETKMRIIRTIGIGESSIAEILENHDQNHEVSVTYRAHRPYVELKLIAGKGDEKSLDDYFSKVSEYLEEFIYERDKQNYFEELSMYLESLNSHFTIYDAGLNGHFSTELKSHLTKEAYRQGTFIEAHEKCVDIEAYLAEFLSRSDEGDLTIIMGVSQDGQYGVGFKFFENMQVVKILPPDSPYLGTLSDMSYSFIAAKTIFNQLSNLSAISH